MKRKLTLAFALFVLNGIAVFAQEAYMTIGSNAATDTSVLSESRNKTYLLTEAIEEAMYTAKYLFDNAIFEVNIYEKNQLRTSKDFADNYIYGTAITAVVNQNYGDVIIDFYRYDEDDSYVDWDVLEFIALDDGRVLCIKGLEI